MFIERNKKNRTQIHDDFAKKNKDSVIRHEKNAISVRKLNKKLEKETEEREFQKYITYYFLKKGQNQSLSKKKKESNNKLQEKAEKLEEIEKQNEEKRKELVKKMKKMDNLREQYKKKKEVKIIEEKIRREEKTKNVKERLDEMDKFEIERRRSVLDYQSESMMRSMNMNATNNSLKKINSGLDSISNQMALQNSVTLFNKKLNELKSKSVNKKSDEEKVKIYKELKRQEAESWSYLYSPGKGYLSCTYRSNHPDYKDSHTPHPDRP